jgi:hypothetical protein
MTTNNPHQLQAQFAKRNEMIAAANKFVRGGILDFAIADLATLAPYLDAGEVQEIYASGKCYGGSVAFAVPATHYRNMYFQAQINDVHKGGDGWANEPRLSICRALYQGKAFTAGGDISRVYSCISHIDRAVAYAQANWPDLLCDDIGRSYIQFVLRSAVPRKPAGERTVMTLHVALGTKWESILATCRMPIGQAIENNILIENGVRSISSDPIIGLQLAAGSKPEAVCYVCSHCGEALRGERCQHCEDGPRSLQEPILLSPALPEILYEYAVRQGHKFDFNPEQAISQEVFEWQGAKSNRVNAAYLRHWTSRGDKQ